jgi:hypothetical protein
LALAAVAGRIRNDSLAGARAVGDGAGELVAQDERPRQAGIADGAFLVPVKIRAA